MATDPPPIDADDGLPADSRQCRQCNAIYFDHDRPHGRTTDPEPWGKLSTVADVAGILGPPPADAAGIDAAQLRAPDLDTYACQRCGWRSGLDAVCPDVLWERISAHAGGVNLLCLWCIDAIAADLGLAFSVSLHFAGRAVHGNSRSDADDEFIERLVAERDTALARPAAGEE